MSLYKLVAVPVLALCITAMPLRAQDDSKAQNKQPDAAAQAAPAPPPAAKPADVASPDAILAATYGVISGPAAQKRDWDRFRSLFIPDARLGAANPKKTGGGYDVRMITPEKYVALADAYFQKNGFSEREIARKAAKGRWGK